MKKILLVEDDSFMIDIYTTKLKEAGFKVIVAKDGREAILKVSEEKPDLLLLDIVLPHLTGFEFLEKLRSLENLKDLPVIILSNLGQKKEIKKGLKLGAVKYLIKAHYTPSQVVEEIKKTLEKYGK